MTDEKIEGDPLAVNPRLYRQLARLLDDMEQGDDANLREKLEGLLNDKRATDATLRPRIEALLEDAGVGLTTRERIAALTAIARVQTVFAALRGHADEPERGAAVRKYSAAFQRPAADAGHRRKASSRSAAIAAALTDDADADEDGAA